MNKTNDLWKTQLHHLRDFHYAGRGGLNALAEDLDVTKATVINWLKEKINRLTDRVIEPNYTNRMAIDCLYMQKEDRKTR